ncbi:MAG: undecaprenyl diphosphate synthase family protein [Candidatus Geothermincolia bacterium]
MIEHVALIASGFTARDAEPGWEALRRLVRAAPGEQVRRLTVFLPAGADCIEALSEASLEDALREWRLAEVRLRLQGEGEGPGMKRLREFAGAPGAGATELLLLAAYDGKRELADATRRLIARGASPADIDDAALAAELYFPDLPDVDLLILTGGERDLAGSMLWQIAYAELYFSEEPWIELTGTSLAAAVSEFGRRVRKFGAIEG